MEKLLGWEDFEIPAKNPPEEVLRRWRSAVTIVRNRRRRFRHVVDLAKRQEVRNKMRSIQEKLRVLFYVQKAASKFIDAGGVGYELSEEDRAAGFRIHPNELASVVHNHSFEGLEFLGGVKGVAAKVNVSLDEGVKSSELPIRQETYGISRNTKKRSKCLWIAPYVIS